MKQFRKLVSSFTALMMGVAASGAGLATAYAAPISSASATLTNVQGGASSVGYTIRFTVTNTVIYGIRLQWRTTASGGSNVTAADIDTNSSLTSVVDHTNADTPIPNWTLDKTNAATTWTLDINDGGTTAFNPGSAKVIDVTLAGIGNNPADNTCDLINDSDTCYIVISTFSNAGLSTVADTGAVSYTVINNTAVTATVDPFLSFTVGGRSGGDIQTGDSFAGCGATTNINTTAVQMQFGNIRPGVVKCAQQSLAVSTNASNGYTVRQLFTGATANVVMTGTVTATNYINAFNQAFTSPAAFGTPNGGTANTNSGWIGIRTTYSGGTVPAGFAGNANYYGAPGNNGTGVMVMDRATPDLGTSPSYVTYKFEVNSAQPADSYSGAIRYNVVGRY